MNKTRLMLATLLVAAPFAHADHEDNAAGETIRDFRERALDFGVTSASFRILLMLLAGLLPVLL
ncbi:MAG: hypothetical protein AAFQ16_07320, partial [Pseudomonadota bacterium]